MIEWNLRFGPCREVYHQEMMARDSFRQSLTTFLDDKVGGMLKPELRGGSGYIMPGNWAELMAHVDTAVRDRYSLWFSHGDGLDGQVVTCWLHFDPATDEWSMPTWALLVENVRRTWLDLEVPVERQSTSYVMRYCWEDTGTGDKVGGQPTHLPATWPRCRECGARMQFTGQIYAGERLVLTDGLGIQMYFCGCEDEFEAVIIPKSAKLNTPRMSGANQLELFAPDELPLVQKSGRSRSMDQPELHIAYEAVVDPIDQTTYMAAADEYGGIADTYDYLLKDKVGGFFPYDGSEGPEITDENRLLFQVAGEFWEPAGMRSRYTLYVYENADGAYVYVYC